MTGQSRHDFGLRDALALGTRRPILLQFRTTSTPGGSGLEIASLLGRRATNREKERMRSVTFFRPLRPSHWLTFRLALVALGMALFGLCQQLPRRPRHGAAEIGLEADIRLESGSQAPRGTAACESPGP